MKNPAIFYGAIVLAIVGIALGVFFLIPGIPHIIADSSYHVKHAILFFGLGVVGIIGAVELFIGLVMYQTYDTPKSSESPKLQ